MVEEKNMEQLLGKAEVLIEVSVPNCLDYYYSYTGSLNMDYVDSSSFLLHFQNCFHFS